MPSFYHLKFELYPCPSTFAEAEDISTVSPSSEPRLATKKEGKERTKAIFVPPPGTDIFETEQWPSHESVSDEPRTHPKTRGAVSVSQDTARSRDSDAGNSVGGVIDCGPRAARGPSPLSEDYTPISPNQPLEFPTPNPQNIKASLQSALKDWRFGRVRVQGLDMERPKHKRGESSSAVGALARNGNGINAGLAPEAVGSQGKVTKARFEPVKVCRAKNTEVGWGVVHLYRDGDLATMGEELYEVEENGGGQEGEGDCTTLCIPAVPSYLTTNDFLGFVGEKTREEVSHFRMVMTGRMNRYLVLMKFRDAEAAKKWRKEWDGKVFNNDLWICLICGAVGCGRYKGGHAKEHWKDSAHNFALEIETQHVWDYAGDMWVHRLIRGKDDSKVIELPSRSRGRGDRGEEDMVPREKLERIGIEYTHLLTSQLESQRVYFEELVGKAVAKASAASVAAASASVRADEALSQLASLSRENRILKEDIIVSLEKDVAREKRKAERSSEIARGFGKSLAEEKKVSEGLMERIGHVNRRMESVEAQMKRVEEENRELVEANRDLLFSITAGEKIREMEGEVPEEGGVLEKGELEGGTVSLPAQEKMGRGKKGKGRGK
ncbi:hypothetical protein QTJ16_003262 [Diplocarpon rosae]|uniref:UBP-type domain-containing protein n=1 Tax=Diplocarpon rosae TaxID=946125 RepID=A0AAD9T119_9HELO|nr:hypothetical protein QTJ16_003262 [Diplocarpon rosae]